MMKDQCDQSFQEAYRAALQAKARHANELMNKANVVGVGIGLDKEDEGKGEPEPVVVVMVERIIPWEKLNPEDRVPKEIDGVRIDVRQVGKIRSLD